MRLPNAANLPLKTSLLFLVASDSPAFSFPLEELDSGDCARLSGASAWCRSSNWCVAPNSPIVVPIICWRHLAREFFQIRWSSSFFSWWHCLCSKMYWRCSSSLCHLFRLAVSAWILLAVECDSYCHLVLKDCRCLFRYSSVSCKMLQVSCRDTSAPSPERLFLRAATSGAILLTLDSARHSTSWW